MQVRPEDTVCVGDDMFRDVFGAGQVGVRTIYKKSWAGAGFHGTSTPDEVIRTLNDLPTALGINMASAPSVQTAPHAQDARPTS